MINSMRARISTRFTQKSIEKQTVFYKAHPRSPIAKKKKETVFQLHQLRSSTLHMNSSHYVSSHSLMFLLLSDKVVASSWLLHLPAVGFRLAAEMIAQSRTPTRHTTPIHGKAEKRRKEKKQKMRTNF